MITTGALSYAAAGFAWDVPGKRKSDEYTYERLYEGVESVPRRTS
jgi:hypothetical protein